MTSNNDFSRQLLNQKINALHNQHRKVSNSDNNEDIMNKILHNDIDNDDNVSMSAQAILNEYRGYVKDFFNIKAEIKACQIAMKNRRNKIKDLEGKIKTFMIENEIEILNTQFGFLSTETKQRKKQVNNKKGILEKARQELSPEEFEKLQKIYKEEIYVKTDTLKIITK
jgi:hypothetical protein